VQARPACHSYRPPRSEAIGADAEHEDIAFLTSRNVHITVRAYREYSSVTCVLNELLQAKSGRHMQLRKVRRWKFRRFENDAR
jgi:hypothetical protein